MKKQQPPENKSSLRKTKIPESYLVFSFKYFDASDSELCHLFFITNTPNP